MRNLIIKLCQWIINKLTPMDDWKTVIPPGEDGITRVITKSGQVFQSKNNGNWLRTL